MHKQLENLVHELRASKGLVGLGAIVLRGDDLAQANSVIGPVVRGERKKASQTALAAEDKWHIGSVTKAITATMLARLVEKQTLSWSTSISDVFSDVNHIHADWGKVTLQHLLTHTSGAEANFSFWVSIKEPERGAARMKARESAVMGVLKKPHKTQLGSAFNYSNVGYTIAGVLAEKVTNTPWETLIEQEIFTPLNLHSGGFGPPQDNGKTLSQPRGHTKNLFGKHIAASTEDDNTPIIGPAGIIHLSLKDLSLFAYEHLKGINGTSELLKAETFQHLHQPLLNDYACGWVTKAPQNVHSVVGPVIWQNGSNGMWYALVAIMPHIHTVVAITSNDCNITPAEQCAWEIIEKTGAAMTHVTAESNTTESRTTVPNTV